MIPFDIEFSGFISLQPLVPMVTRMDQTLLVTKSTSYITAILLASGHGEIRWIIFQGEICYTSLLLTKS